MFKERFLGTICDGEIEYVTFSDSVWEGAKIVLQSFFENESISIGVELNLPETQAGRDELMQLCYEIAKDGCSIVARETATKRVVGVVFNKVQHLSDDFFGKSSTKICKTENSRGILDLMVEICDIVNLYDLHKTDCLYEIEFLGTLPEFRGKHIALNIVKYSLQLARELRYGGEHVNYVPDHLKDRRPTAAISIYSSKYSQRIGDICNMKVHARVNHKDYIFKGKNYMERIPDPTQATSTLVSVVL